MGARETPGRTGYLACHLVIRSALVRNQSAGAYRDGMKRSSRAGVEDRWHRPPKAREKVSHPTDHPGPGVWCTDPKHQRKRRLSSGLGNFSGSIVRPGRDGWWLAIPVSGRAGARWPAWPVSSRVVDALIRGVLGGSAACACVST